MRISELSRAIGVPVPTIKYYLREGLVPRGAVVPRNQADYGDAHVRRLRLIRALREVGDLGIAGVRMVIGAIDDPGLSLHDVLGVVDQAQRRASDPGPVPEDAVRARADVDRFIDGLGWRTSHEAPARARLAEALLILRRLGRDVDTGIFEPYAAAADALAAAEVASVPADVSRDEAVEYAVVGTVVLESALVALRRLAQEHHSARLLDRYRVADASA